MDKCGKNNRRNKKKCQNFSVKKININKTINKKISNKLCNFLILNITKEFQRMKQRKLKNKQKTLTMDSIIYQTENLKKYHTLIHRNNHPLKKSSFKKMSKIQSNRISLRIGAKLKFLREKESLNYLSQPFKKFKVHKFSP